LKRRSLFYISASLLIACAVIVYLLLTGERGLSRRVEAARMIEVTRLDPSETGDLGWNPDRLTAVFEHVATLSTDTLAIVTNGEIVGAFGDLSRPLSVHSIRKSLLSALVGQHIGSGKNQLHLDATLLDLGIDDAPIPLTALQRQTTLRHLLKSLSGINHPAAASGSLQADIDRRLGQEENEPGTIWAYNNWDYNALTTIFENETGVSIAEAFENGIGRAIGLQDFKRTDVTYISDVSRSEHKAAMFKLSARDLLRIGELFLNGGPIDDQPLFSQEWVDLITQDFTETGLGGMRWGHGYLWWIPGPSTGLPDGTFWAWGLGNQALMVIPEWNSVIVHQSNTTEFRKRFLPMISDEGMTGEAAIEQLILSCRQAANRKSEYCIEHRFITRREFDQLVSLIVAARK